jgi:hypothetical protein
MSEKLLELAAQKFGTLTDAEQRFYRGVASGKFPDFSSPVAEENDPATAANWPASRVLAADRVAWLATDPDASRLVTHRGIGMKGCRIDGRLDLQAINIVYALYFERCSLPAGINLMAAEIHALNLSGSHAGRITCDGMKVEASVLLRAGFCSTGRVRLIGCRIGGNLDCGGGMFLGQEGEALLVDGAHIEGSVLLNQGFCAQGQVRFLGAQIAGNLSCDLAQFIHPGKDALTADRLKIDGNVFLNGGMHVDGRVGFPSALIHGFFVWHGISKPQDATLDLRSAKIGTLWVGRESWPQPGNLHLHGLTYDLLDDRHTLDAATWISFLRLQPHQPFRPQPYEQLAAVLRKDGQDSDAKEVQYAKEVDRGRSGKLAWSQIPWYRIFGPLIGYGYKPWRALWLSVLVVIVGAILFGVGASQGLMVPAKAEAYIAGADGKQMVSENYAVLNPLMYSVDVFTPLIDLDQADYWLPGANRGQELGIGPLRTTTGGLLRFYMWIHIIAGWVLSSLLFVGLTGTIPGL